MNRKAKTPLPAQLRKLRRELLKAGMPKADVKRKIDYYRRVMSETGK